jgi:hypothetical protein
MKSFPHEKTGTADRSVHAGMLLMY